MKKGQLKTSTNNWMMVMSDTYGFDPETIKGLYKEMLNKHPTHAKSKTLEFIQLYLQGRNEN